MIRRLQVSAACYSSVGLFRDENEDSFYFHGLTVPTQDDFFADCTTSAPISYAIFDGMGGESNGKQASKLSAYLFAQWINRLKKDPGEAREYIDAANKLICAEINQNGGRMGSTAAIVSISKRHIHACNLGDSRVYLFRGGELRQLSQDHTEAQIMLRMNLLSPEEALTHPARNRLTQHLGVFESELAVEPYCTEMGWDYGDKILVCSDGLTDMVSDEEIKRLFTESVEISDAVQKMGSEALKAGGMDNVTLIALELRRNTHLFWGRKVPVER